ncbi:hypothetical protein ACOJBO_07915 [Rhizobium beringeri]
MDWGRAPGSADRRDPAGVVFIPFALTAARARQVMQDEVSADPASVTELPRCVGKPVAEMKSVWLPFRQ